MRALPLVLLALQLVAPGCSSSPASAPSDAADRCSETPAGRVSLPADDAVHNDLIEWWYWTGHLQDADGNWYGFEQTFFRNLMLGQMVHIAITDVPAGSFHFSTHIGLGAYPVVANGFDLSVAGSTARGGDGHDVLHGVTADGYVFDLDLQATKAPVLQHEDGYTDYSFGGYTYYYSRERMRASGTLSVGGTPKPVTGEAWFDHQWGDISRALNLGWDWFALQLEDGREIMLFIVRSSSAIELVGGSHTDASCATTQIALSDVQVFKRGEWTSPRTGCTYPSGWDVTVAGMSFAVVPAIADQEVSSSTPIYWEGACVVTGSAEGRAYVELTGYCP